MAEDIEYSKNSWRLTQNGQFFSLYFCKPGGLISGTRHILDLPKRDIQDLYELLRDSLNEEKIVQPLEIERKFLLTALPDIEPDYVIAIQQYYLPDKGRVRESHITDYHTKIRTIEYHSCVKKLIAPGVFEENEHQITEAEYYALRAKCPTGLKKVRHVYKRSDGLKWEIDVYSDDLIVAELEIPSVDYIIKMERYIAELIVTEVTGRSEYYNSTLAKTSQHYVEVIEYTREQMQAGFDKFLIENPSVAKYYIENGNMIFNK